MPKEPVCSAEPFDGAVGERFSPVISRRKYLSRNEKDFEPANRKKFCSRIATGDYDAVIIGHSQFEKIPLSIERQEAMIERQISEIELAIEQAKADNGERYTIKQMEKTRNPFRQGWKS